ncbi:hypothetical protein CBL_08513 [Carabus blaptoides fortunei]
MYSSTNKNLGGRHKDPVWGFFTEISSESGKITGQECKECGQIVSSRALRMKKHTQTCSVIQSKAEASKRVLSSDSEDDVPLQQHIIRSRSSSTTSASPSTSSSSISVKKQISTPSTSGSKNFLQPKILSHVITTTTTQADQLDLDVARYMFSCNVPFSHVEKFYFQKLLNNLRLGYKPPTRQKLATKLLDTIHNEVVTEASDYLSGKMVTVVQDGWSTIHNDPVVANCISTGDKTFFLSAIDTGANHKTSEYCLTLALDANKEAKIKFNCSGRSFVSDNENKMVKLRDLIKNDLSEFQGGDFFIIYGCAAHYLNFLGTDISKLNSINKLINQIIEVQKYFRNHHVAKGYL